MALANYTDLVSAVEAWLNRSDLTSRIPDFIALAEAEFNRTLRTIEMETRATATLTGEALAVPSDFIGLRSVSVANTKFEYLNPSDLFDLPTTYTGTPRFVTVTDGQFFFRPVPSSGEVTVDYYAKIPALTSTNTTNWLMTAHPDLYLFATLAQAEFYGWNDDRLPLVKSRTEELIAQVNEQANKVRYGNRTVRMMPQVQGSVGRVAA